MLTLDAPMCAAERDVINPWQPEQEQQYDQLLFWRSIGESVQREQNTTRTSKATADNFRRARVSTEREPMKNTMPCCLIVYEFKQAEDAQLSRTHNDELQ